MPQGLITALRIVGYAIAGFLLLALVFAILLMVGIGAFGMAMVRSDLFAMFAGGYWLVGLAIAVIGAGRLGVRRSGA